MKKLISLLLCLCMVLSLLPTAALAANDASGTLDSGLTWRVEDGTLTISGTGEMEEFSESTPAPWQALAEGIAHIVVDNGVTRIGSYAFSGCAAAEDISIPDSVTKIGTNVFKGCAALKGLEIPTSVERFDRFGEGCTSLVSLTLPVALVKYGSFRTYEGKGREDLSAVKHLTFKGPGTLEGMIYRNKPLHFWALNKGIQITLDGVTGLGYAALAFCDFETFTIPDSVTTIGEEAFYECDQLRRIVIPAGVTSIGDTAFYGCGELQTVRLNAAAEFGACIFMMCQKLSDVTLPEGLTTIPVGMFDCCGLTSVRLPSTLKRIGDDAFSANPLRSITIPNGVESIGRNAFFSCRSLTKVSLPESLTDIEGGAFRDCQSLPQIILPSGLTVIKDQTFDQCEKLAMVEIPKGVTTIEDGVFYNCLSLREVWYPGSEEEWENISVASSGSGGTVYMAHANYSLLSATVHYGYTYAEWLEMHRTDPRAAELTLTAGEHALRIINEEGEPLEGALVEWPGGSATSGADGIAKFTLTGAATVTISCEGYLPQEHAVGNGGAMLFGSVDKPKQGTQKTVVMPKDMLSLVSALCYYPTDAYAGTNVLTNERKLPGKAAFKLVCKAAGSDAYIYCLFQKQDGKETLISTSANGTFTLSADKFKNGAGCFVRVYTSDQKTKRDTAINLTFKQVPDFPTINIGNGSFSFAAPKSVPVLSNLTFEIPRLENLPVYIKTEGEKVKIGVNLSKLNEKENEQADDKLEQVKTILHRAEKNRTLPKNDLTTLENIAKSNNKKAHFGLGEVTASVLGYFEGDLGADTCSGYLFIKVKVPLGEGEWNGAVWIIPCTVRFGLNGEANGKFGITLYTNTPSPELRGNLDVGFKLTLDVFGGAGLSKYAGAGVYGEGSVETALHFAEPPVKISKCELKGEIGLEAYLLDYDGKLMILEGEYDVITGKHSGSAIWNSASLLDAYDASSYQPSDLSYLSAESDWLGGTRASLMEAEARTELTPLLTDTYRNARPVMVATDDALYAAFIRAEQTGKRYIAVTKYSGGAWSEPAVVDAEAILNSDPNMYFDGTTLRLAYARTTEMSDSLRSQMLHQQIVVGTLDLNTLAFNEEKCYNGSGTYLNSPCLTADALVWLENTVGETDDTALTPTAVTLRCARYQNGAWDDAETLASVDGRVLSLAADKTAGALSAAYVLNGDEGSNLYRVTAGGQPALLAEGVSGRVSYGVLPGDVEAGYLWNESEKLCSSTGSEAPAAGITNEYAVAGDGIYYSASGETGAQLTAVKRSGDGWTLPIRMTGGERYLENLSAVRMNGNDYIFGIDTLAEFNDDGTGSRELTTRKNLVWSAIMPVSDLRLDGVEFDAPDAGSVGEALPVTLTVTNAGDHTVTEIAVTAADVTTNQAVSLKPGESTELTASITCPEGQTSVTFSVAEPDKDDYTPEDNAVTRAVACADAALELNHVSVGKLNELEALVTNEGVEPASGSVSFYNENGGLLATRTFENLAPGGLVVARLASQDAASLFADGGDVSAEVVLDGSEDVLWNNTASKHIDGPDTAVMSVEISGTSVSAEIYCAEATGGTAYCASYDANGKMLGVTSTALTKGNNTASLTCIEDAEQVKVFVLNGDGAPLCAAWKKND